MCNTNELLQILIEKTNSKEIIYVIKWDTLIEPIVCPVCKGEKTQTIYVWDKKEYVPCSVCSGSGVIKSYYYVDEEKVKNFRVFFHNGEVDVNLNYYTPDKYRFTKSEAQIRCNTLNGFLPESIGIINN